MKILFLAASNFAVTKVIPDLLSSNVFSEIAVASRSLTRVSRLPPGIVVFTDYQQALHDFPADIVYVSTVNSEHYSLSKLALEAGKHVVVDKPATTSLGQAQDLVRLATSKGLLISEALFYEYHPQIDELKHLLSSADKIQYVSAVFSVPTFLQDNFRYRAELGGGVIFDLGPYAVSLARVLLQADVTDIVARTTEFSSESLPLAFSMLLTLSNGAVLSGYFGFNSEYTNRVEILGENMRISIDRVFTTPPDYQNTCAVAKGNVVEEKTLPVGSSINRYFTEIVRAISDNDIAPLREILLNDAAVLHQLLGSVKH